MANSSFSHPPRNSFDKLGMWLMEIFELFIGKWWLWLLQGLIFSTLLVLPAVAIAKLSHIDVLLPIFTTGAKPALMHQVEGQLVLFSSMLVLIVLLMSVTIATLLPGMINTALKQMRGERVSVLGIFSGVRFGRGFFLISMVIALGWFACCLGVLYTVALFCLAAPIMIDRSVTVKEALLESYRTTGKEVFFFLVYFPVIGVIMYVASALLNIIHLDIIAHIAYTAVLPIAIAVAYERTFLGYEEE